MFLRMGLVGSVVDGWEGANCSSGSQARAEARSFSRNSGHWAWISASSMVLAFAFVPELFQAGEFRGGDGLGFDELRAVGEFVGAIPAAGNIAGEFVLIKEGLHLLGSAVADLGLL
jgi:hypothetical protein